MAPARDTGPGTATAGGVGRYGLRIAFVLLVALLVSGAGWAIWDSRQTEIAEYQSNQAKMGLVLAEQTTRALQVVDLVVQAIRNEVTEGGVDTPDHFRTFMSTEARFQQLQARQEHMPQLEALVVLDAKGRAINSSRAWPPSGAVESDADVFTHFDSITDNGAYISKPQKSDLTNDWAVYLARRVIGRNGQLIGIVAAAISLRYFRDGSSCVPGCW